MILNYILNENLVNENLVNGGPVNVTFGSPRPLLLVRIQSAVELNTLATELLHQPLWLAHSQSTHSMLSCAGGSFMPRKLKLA